MTHDDKSPLSGMRSPSPPDELRETVLSAAREALAAESRPTVWDRIWESRTLRLAWTRRIRIRHLRLVCDRLIFPPAQLPLFADDQKQTEKRDNIVSAIDRIRQRFGQESIQAGRTMAA